jgi:hypothetical protein
MKIIQILLCFLSLVNHVPSSATMMTTGGEILEDFGLEYKENNGTKGNNIVASRKNNADAKKFLRGDVMVVNETSSAVESKVCRKSPE